MQYCERSIAPPAILYGAAARMHRTTLHNFMAKGREQRSQHHILRSSLNLDDESMREGLYQSFNGRCAFCEASVTTRAYRFRPAEQAEPYQKSDQAHLYYSWLDIAWQNLYSICYSCLPKSPNFFPVKGKRAALPALETFKQYEKDNTGVWPDYPPNETPLLLDPCQIKKFENHFVANANGTLTALTPQGAETIRHFNLNALRREKERASAYRIYFSILLKGVTSETANDFGVCFDFSSLEFGGTWYLLLRRLAAAVGPKSGVRPVLSRKRIKRVFQQLRQRRNAAIYLEQCWDALVKQPLNFVVDTSEKPGRTSNAMLQRIRIKHFKAIEHLDITFPVIAENAQLAPYAKTPALLIIGENAAGKSSILEAITLGLCPQPTIDTLGITAENFILDPSFLGAAAQNRSMTAQVEIQLSDGYHRNLEITPGSIRTFSDGPDTLPVFAYGAFRQYQYKGRQRSAEDAYVRNLFDSQVLPNPEKWLLGLTKEDFAMVIRALGDILSIGGAFEVVQRDPDHQRCHVVTAMTDDGLVQSQSTLNVASSGFRSILAMTCDVMRGLMDKRVNPDFQSLNTARGVVLIDEVEAHLHPRWKMRIMEGLRRALPQVTFIATTHDPLCLRGMGNKEIMVLRRVQTDTPTDAGLMTQVEPQTELPPASELSIEQLLTSDLFRLYSTDAPETDRQFAKVADLLAKAEQDLTENESNILDLFQKDIASALPIGTSEAHRVVQEAVADYLKMRSSASAERLATARAEVKESIIRALQGAM